MGVVLTTASADIKPSELTRFYTSASSTLTEFPKTQRDSNYKNVPNTHDLTNIQEDVQLQATIQSDVIIKTPTAAVAEQRFKGVVDQIALSASRVTLFYRDKENPFLFPTELLKNTGIDYVGALFEIVLKKEDEIQSFDIVHLVDEERRSRARATGSDLAFLDEVERTSNARGKRD